MSRVVRRAWSTLIICALAGAASAIVLLSCGKSGGPVGASDDPSAAFTDAYGVWGAPTHYFIGSDGIIRDRYFGPMNTDLIETSLGAILPAAAR